MSRDPFAANGGLARTRELLDAGWSRHHLAKAIAAGTLVRPRRGWVARGGADPALLDAASHGLMLTCISQAKRLGLWVREEPQKHFAVPRPGAEVRPQSAQLHYGRPLIPRAPGVLEDPIENVLHRVAHCQPFEDAVVIWDSAFNRKMINRTAMERYPLRGRARRVLDATSPFADSGLESYVRLRLSWIGVAMIAQVWLEGHRVDFLIGKRLVLQIDGGTHVGAQRTSDVQHDAKLRLLGYTVVRVGYEQVMREWPGVQDLVMRAIAQELHLAR